MLIKNKMCDTTITFVTVIRSYENLLILILSIGLHKLSMQVPSTFFCFITSYHVLIHCIIIYKIKNCDECLKNAIGFKGNSK